MMMTMPKTKLLFLLLGTTAFAAAANIRNFQKPPSSVVLPAEAEEHYYEQDRWTSLINEQTEFLRVNDNMELTQRLLSSSNAKDRYQTQAYVPAQDEEFDEYQTAWRYLGLMIDCDVSTDDDDWNSGSYDGGTGEGCSRYLLWAAYVDLDYEGGGIGEYQYWDRTYQKWDTRSCLYADGGGNSGDNNDDNNNNGYGRCAKMDCHLENTHWSLLGLFKHRSPDDWMEQLFKHSGYCLWTRQEYNFMNNARDTWPKGCSVSYYYDDIYYDLQPQTGGSFTIGLYSDTRCVEPYTGELTAEQVVGNVLSEAEQSQHSNENGGYYEEVTYDTLQESIAAWEKSFDVYKICNPCVAHDLNNVGYNNDDDSMKGSSYMGGNAYYYNNNGNDYNDFDCYDDADYTNVNQCMKFMAKTTINAATYRDLSLAIDQGSLSTVLPVVAAGEQSYMRNQGARSFLTLVLFLCSAGFLYFSGMAYYKIRKAQKGTNADLKESMLT